MSRARVWLVATYAAAALVLAIVSVTSYADQLRIRRSANAAMRELARDVDRTLASVEVSEAEDDLRFQIVHVAWAQLNAARPEADAHDVELAKARQRALDILRERYRDALTDSLSYVQ